MPNAELPDGVVLDEPMGRALLFAATQENLLDAEPSIGDGFVRKLLARPPEQKLLDGAFEQLVLGGKAYLPFWIPPAWKGELFERGLVAPVEYIPSEDLIEAPEMSSELVLGMLDARGAAWSPEELRRAYTEYVDAHNHWDRVSGAKSLYAIEILMIVRHIGKDATLSYSAEELEAYERVQHAKEAMRPIIDCIEAYRHVLTASLRLSALSALPTAPSDSSTIDISRVSDSTERTALLRVTCSALRRVPIGSTLRETVALATTPEAHGLRIRLAGWAETARAGDLDPVSLALSDVQSARKALAGAKTLTRVGEYATWIGLPLGVAGALI